MVSEGVDIPRLRAVVYLTNRMTLLSFRQIVGRVVRTDKKNESDFGRVYIPADPLLVEMAREVAKDVNLGVAAMKIETDRTPSVVKVFGDRNLCDWQTLGSVAQQGSVFDTEGRTAEASLISGARRFIELHELLNTDPESLALAALSSDDLRRTLLEMSEP